MKRLIGIFVLLCAARAFCDPAYVRSKVCTAMPCSITAPTNGNTLLVSFDGTSTPATMHDGTPALTLVSGANGSPLTDTASGNHISWWYAAGITGGGTSVTCTSCTGPTKIVVWEFSGVDTSNPIDHLITCHVPSGGAGDICENQANPPKAATYSPGFTKEAAVTAWTCSGSSTSFGGSTWLNTDFTSGEATGELITSSIGSITAYVDTGCGNASGTIIGLKGAGSTQSCTWDISGYYNDSTESAGSTVTVAAIANSTSDLLLFFPWCYTDCGVTTLTYGSATPTIFSAVGATGTTAGQPRVAYLIGPSAVGSATTTFTPSGSPSHAQVAYMGVTPSAGCTITYDSTVGSGTGAVTATGTGSPANTPSFSPASGDFVANFTAVQSHATVVGSPFSCLSYDSSGGSTSCFTRSTVNSISFVLSSSGTVTNNISQLTPSGEPWNAILAAFNLTGTSTGTKRLRGSVIQ